MRKRPAPFNGLLAINKPQGLTSHDVVARLRRILNTTKVGHAGTLDPLATGVLIIGVGEATRLLGHLTLERKSYLAKIALGASSNTDDAEGELSYQEKPAALFEEISWAQEKCHALIGEHMQVPPQFSAISVNGKRAYAAAREGKSVELEARPIEIYSSELIAIESDDKLVYWTVMFEVSKGTYIRSIARDLGEQLGSAGFIQELQRLSSGKVKLKSALSLEALEEKSLEEVQALLLDPIDVLDLPSIDLNPAQFAYVEQGRALRLPQAQLTAEEGQLFSLVFEHRLRGIWKKRGSSLVCVANFPTGIEGCK